MADFFHALNIVFKNEGGFVNDSRDPGGRTNLGVTEKTLNRMVASGSTPELAGKRVEDLTHQDAALIYRRGYWDKVMGDEIPSTLIATEVFDTAVNASPRKAVRFLQEALNGLAEAGLVEDGAIGPRTLTALRKYLNRRSINEPILLKTLNGLQFNYYWSLVRARPALRVFLEGWINLRVGFGG